jgi:hypothetical protein
MNGGSNLGIEYYIAWCKPLALSRIIKVYPLENPFGGMNCFINDVARNTA